jgi:hypothetical protein
MQESCRASKIDNFIMIKAAVSDVVALKAVNDVVAVIT